MIRNATWFALVMVVCRFACGGVAWGQATPTQPAAPVESPAADEIRGRLAAYVEAFNRHDADGLAAFWAADGESIDLETGEQTAGRDALRTEFGAFFDENKTARLMGRIDDVRLIRPDVATVEGATMMFLDDGAIESAFSAIFVKEGDQWLISSSRERDLPTPATAYDALKELEWLVGAWRDDSSDAAVETNVRWTANRTFLVRSFNARTADGETFEGTQVFGWDPLSHEIRTWTFHSDGSFGEGTAAKLGDDWLLKMSQTLADGRLSVATQVITRVDENTITAQLIAQTLDGEPVPSSEPITVRRVMEPETVSNVVAPAAEGAAP